jgi:hypothetical protein
MTKSKIIKFIIFLIFYIILYFSQVHIISSELLKHVQPMLCLYCERSSFTRSCTHQVLEVSVLWLKICLISMQPLTKFHSIILIYRGFSRLINAVCWIWGFHSGDYEEVYPTGYNAVYTLTLKIDVTCSSETSADFHRTTSGYIPEDKTTLTLLHLHIYLKPKRTEFSSRNLITSHNFKLS